MRKISELTDLEKNRIISDLVICLNNGRLRDAIAGWTVEDGVVTPNKPWESWDDSYGVYTPEAPSWVSLSPLGLGGWGEVDA